MLFLDLETLCVPDDDDISKYGIACIAYIYLEGKTLVKGIIENREGVNPFFSPSFQSVLNQHQIICGYNSNQFDIPILKANNYSLESHSHFDLLEEIRVASGQPPKHIKGKTRGGYSLKSVANANGFLTKYGVKEKEANQKSVTELWQNRQYKAVSDYCLKDVELTCQIYHRFINGGLRDPNDGTLLGYNKEVSTRERLRWAEVLVKHVLR